MKSVRIIQVNAEPLLRFEEENLSGILLPPTRFASASVGMIQPGTTQAPHAHDRPQQGSEMVFIYEGAFELVCDGRPIRQGDVERDGPFYVDIPSGMVVSIRNAGVRPVRFFTVFAPPFEIEELRYVGQ